jgi:hypothetical protein
MKKLAEIVHTVHLIPVDDFFSLFQDVLPSIVSLDDYIEKIRDSDISFGSNTDTLMTIYEAYSFLRDVVPGGWTEQVQERWIEVDTILDTQYDTEKELFVSLGC